MKWWCIKKAYLILVLLLILTVSLAGCAKPPQNSESSAQQAQKEDLQKQQPEKEKVLVLGYDRDAEILDTIKTAWYSDALIYIYDRLVSRDYDFKYKPGLAESWETSEDGLTWTFHLRKDVKFHDGKPFKAEDVKWTIDTIKNPDTGSPFRGDLEAIKEVIVKDDYTVDIVLNYPFPNLLFNLSNTAAGIQEKDVYTKYDDDYGTKVVIGTGPYKFKEWIKGDRIVLEKNPDYNWGPEWMSNRGPALIDKIVLRVIPDENARMMELETGGIHILRDVPETYLERLEKVPEITIYKGPATKLGYLAYPTDKKPFTDVRVRRAINYAINRDDIIQYVFRGIGQTAYGYLPPALKDEYLEESKDLAYKYDPEKAKQLLAEAGYPNGLKLTLSADNSSKSTKLAQVLQNQLKQVGIETDIRLYDSSSYTAMLKEGKQELFLREYSWPNADILDWFLLSSQFPYPNHSRWKDKTTDELIKKASRMPTWEERAQGYKDVQKYLIEQAVWCPIYVPEKIFAVRKEVLNFKFHPWMLMFNDGFDLKVE
ncbi:ABC transporter substrate-binding protein [Biomaibacter acetigenes]|uniref:ABC transporter substrate-binding protein n=1 Tax=Biomaibacter acetigenes TaxID=2316383 RepID=A0A3G2R7I0_9FIRM|nr:ABC transporter substrate-binding protein [Biomaibacter acetigenes]AYO31391.1 ABC transporter substrate-binding protein [Biomaibacter acetigenes]